MYKNFGDRNFFERGRLVDDEHSDNEILIIACNPYDDVENKYQYAHLSVDITDSWIDKQSVMDFIGMTEDSFDAIQFALGCIDFYSWDNFGADMIWGADWKNADREYIEKDLKHQLIASDNLDMPWIDEPVTWICIDADDLQYGRRIDDGVWQYIQFDRTPDGNGEVREETIDLSDYTDEEIVGYIEAYGYKDLDVLKSVAGADWKQVAIECIFEQQGFGAGDSNEEVSSFEEAERLIKAFIWGRHETLYGINA